MRCHFAAGSSLSRPSIYLTSLTNFLISLLIRNFRQPVAEAERSEQLADPLFEQACRMSWRNLPNKASDLQFVGDFSSCPLTDRASCSDRSLTRECCHLTTLFCRKLGSRSRAGSILKSLSHAQRFQVNPLQSYPPIPPQAYGVHIDA
jgi:hypothetical protein